MSDEVKTLPVFQTVGDSIKYTFANIGLMIQLIWFWGALIAAVSMIVYFAGGSEVIKLIFLGVQNPNADWGINDVLFFAAVFLLYMIATYSVFVGWHRGLLLDERPTGVHATVSKRELSYFLRTLALIFGLTVPLGLIVGLVGVVALVAGQGAQPDGAHAATVSIGAIVAFVGIFALIVFWGRFVLVLPGAAVGDRRVSFRASFAMTKGNSWRLFWGFCLIFLFQIGVILVLALVVLLISTGDMEGWMSFLSQPVEGGEVSSGYVVFAALQFLFSMVFMFFALSYMSYCYWFFVPPPGQGDLA